MHTRAHDHSLPTATQTLLAPIRRAIDLARIGDATASYEAESALDQLVEQAQRLERAAHPWLSVNFPEP